MEKRRKKGPARRPPARAEDVLGKSLPTRPVKPKWRKAYRVLVDLREELLRRRGDLARDAATEKPAYSMHMADAGTDSFDRDFALSLISSEQDALYEVDQALNRIRDGTYGICELTGKSIEPQRLETIPWTRFSAAAERQLEKQGEVARARLGPRQEVPKVNPMDREEEEQEEE